MALSDLLRTVGRKSESNDEALNIIEFIENPFGLAFSPEITNGMGLFPVQKFILKAFYNLPLDKKERNIRVPKDWRYVDSAKPEHYLEFTEAEYMRYLYEEGRCNIKEQDHERHELVLPLGRRAGKCARLDTTYVYTSEGLLSLREMGPQGVELKPDTWYEVSDRTIAQEGVGAKASTSSFYYRGRTKTFRATSRCGYSIEGTAEHRVKVLTPEGIQWKFCNELREGDYLCVHRNVGLWPEHEVDIPDNSNWADLKRVPRAIRQSPKSVVASFLQGLFDAGGRFASSYREMCQDVQLLLLNFGIISAIRRNADGYDLCIYGDRSRRIFYEEIDDRLDIRDCCAESIPFMDDWGKSLPDLSVDGNIAYGQGILDLDYFFDPVVLVEESEAEVGDLSVPEGHQYVAQGLTNHNSSISSMIAAYEIYRLLKKNNPQRYYGIQDGAEISLSTVATTKDQSKILYNAVRNHFQNCDFFRPYIAHDTQSYVSLQSPFDLDTTGAAGKGGRASIQIKFFSSVSSGIRGLANIVIILDEVAFFKDKGNSSAEAVYQAASPSVATFAPANPGGSGETLTNHSEGRIVLISSPFNKDGLFYDKYEQARAGGLAGSDILMVQAPTWEVNPQVPQGFLANQHGKDPIAFATEFGAQFTDRVSAWIEREKDLMVCIDRDLRATNRGKPRVAHALGLDLAVKGDRTAVALTRPDGDKIRLVYHEEWQPGRSWYDLNPHLEAPLVDYARDIHTVDMLDFDEIGRWVKELSKRFLIVDGLFDQWQGISFAQDLENMGLTQIQSKQFTRDETSQMFDAFKTLMYHGRLLLYDYTIREVDYGEDDDEVDSITGESSTYKHAPYIKELLELRAERRSKKVISVEAPSGANKHDDFADALVRSVWLSLNRAHSNSYIAGRKGRGNDDQGGVGGHGPMSSQHYQYRRQRRNNYLNKRGDKIR